MKLLFSAAALVLALLCARLAHAWEATPASLAAVRGGQAWAEVLPDGPGASGVVHGVVEINASPQRVWQVMNDCRTAALMVTNLKSCRILKTGPNGAWDVREHVTRKGLLVPEVRNVFHNDYTPVSLIRFYRVEGDLKAMRGEWRLIPLDGGRRTRVTYENHIAADFPGPAFLVRDAIRKDTPKVLMNLKRVCEVG